MMTDKPTVCDHLQRPAIDGEELGRLLDAYRATQKGGAE